MIKAVNYDIGKRDWNPRLQQADAKSPDVKRAESAKKTGK